MSALPPELDVRRDETLDKDRWDRAMGWIAARLRAHDAFQPSWEAAVNELRQFGLTRLNDAVQPVYDRLSEIAQIGALFTARSTTPLALTAGSKLIQVSEDDRQRFAAAAYLSIQAVGDPALAMSGALASYDRETGLLTVIVDHVTGAGSAESWIVSASGPPEVTHAGRTDNPHGVTAEQIGAPTVSQMTAAINDAIVALRSGVDPALDTLVEIANRIAAGDGTLQDAIDALGAQAAANATAIAGKASQSALDAVSATVAANATATTAALAGKASTDGSNLTGRLAPVAATITDWNSATSNGWYMSDTAANAPGAGWWIGQSINHGALGYCIQLAWPFTAMSPTAFGMQYRVQFGGSWSAWTDCYANATEILALVNANAGSVAAAANALVKRDASGGATLHTVTATSGYINSRAIAGGNAHYWLQDETGAPRAIAYWERATNKMWLGPWGGNSLNIDGDGVVRVNNDVVVHAGNIASYLPATGFSLITTAYPTVNVDNLMFDITGLGAAVDDLLLHCDPLIWTSDVGDNASSFNIGDSGGPETDVAFPLVNGGFEGPTTQYAFIWLKRLVGNSWMLVGHSGVAASVAVTKTLSGALDRVRIRTSHQSAQFATGSNIKIYGR